MLPDIARFCPFFEVTVTKTVTIRRFQRVMRSGIVKAVVTATIADWFIEPAALERDDITLTRIRVNVMSESPSKPLNQRLIQLIDLIAKRFNHEHQALVWDAPLAVQSLGSGMNIVEYPAHRAISSRSLPSTGVFGHGFRQHICHPCLPPCSGGFPVVEYALGQSQ